jgi:hypothetical protein
MMRSLIVASFAVAGAWVVACAIAEPTGPTMERAEGFQISELKGEWTGSFDQFSHDIEGSFPVKMSIDTITDNEFKGTMDWPTFNDCKTEVRGMFDGKSIIWTETAYLRII